jgi:signal transduction histidine kinase
MLVEASEHELSELREERRLFATLDRIGRVLNGELQLDRLVQLLTDEATALCRAQFGSFFYNLTNEEGESYVLYTLSGVPRERFSGFPMPRNTAVFAPTFNGERPVRSDDITQDPRYGHNPPYHGMPKGHLPVRSYLALPVVSRTGDVLGGLFFGHGEPGVFTERDEQLLVAVASQAAVAIDNARLYQQTRVLLTAERTARAAAEGARRRTERLQAVTAALSRALTAEEVGRMVIRETLPALDASTAAIFLRSADPEQLELFVVDGEYDGWNARAPLRLSDRLPLCEAVTQGKVVWAASAGEIDARWPALTAAREGVQSWGAVPLFYEERIIGGLGFACKEERSLAPEDEEFLLSVGRQCAQAIVRAQLFDEVRAARADAESANRAKDEFLAMLGHELRNPLSPILTALHLMKLRGQESREEAVIERQVGHLARLVDDLLDVARVAQGKINLRTAPVEVSDVVWKGVEMASPLLEERQHELHLDLPRSGLRVDGDELRLAQVLGNLLTNAAKYTERGGQVSVRARRDGGQAVIAVRDSGIGIAAELLPHIFDRFVQGARGSDRSEGGLGLGLTLVKSLVLLHRGEVSVRSDGHGHGSEFEVRLPALSEEAEAEPTPQPEEPEALERRRVLVVDDNADAADLLAELLGSYGHEVLVSHDGPRALELLANFRPEVAILDIGLPVMDGYELAARMREKLDGVMLVALTGYGQDHDRARSAAAGFHHHLVKPVDPGRLLALISGAPAS